MEIINEKIKCCLVGMYKQFVDEVEPACILDLLIQERIINTEEREKIVRHTTKKERCRALLDKLFSTPNPQAFLVLKEALDEDYKWIADELNKNYEQIDIGYKRLSNRSNGEQSKENLWPQLKEAELTIEQLQSENQNLRKQVECKEEELVELKSHNSILQSQIAAVAESRVESDGIFNSLEHSNTCNQVDRQRAEDISEPLVNTQGNHSDLCIIESGRIIKSKKIPKYCQELYDIWIGHVEGLNRPVSIKELLCRDPQHEKKFFSEADLLAGLDHPRIANFLGRSPIGNPETFTVFESSDLGNVLTFLKSRTAAALALAISNSDRYHLRWIVQMAHGLEYLHSKRILHRSIFVSNLLVCNSGYSIKITNFQNSIHLDDNDCFIEAIYSAQIECTAPELVSENKWSLGTDVWSFGLTALKILIKCGPVFAEMTTKDIKDFFMSSGPEEIEALLDEHLIKDSAMKSTLLSCLHPDYKKRPSMSTLVDFNCYEENNSSNPFTKKHRYEHVIVHKNPVRGITSLNNILYAIFVSSSSIECYDIKNNLSRMNPIKLGANARSAIKSIFRNRNSSTAVAQRATKPFRVCTNNLKSLDSCAISQCLYVLDVGKYVVFEVSVRKQKVTCSWKVPEHATCLSVVEYQKSILVSYHSGDFAALAYTSEGETIWRLGRGSIMDGPWKAHKAGFMQCLILHGDVYSNTNKNNTVELCMIGHDGVLSSGYGTMPFQNISDVVLHHPSKSILLADMANNRIISIDKYLKKQPVDILNLSDGIVAPCCLHVVDDLVFVGLNSGNIHCFQFF